MTTTPHRHRHNIPAAHRLRTHQTTTELLLWRAERDRRLAGLKFRRQHPIGPFVADFCCPDRRLIVELDGGVHARQQADDAEREALLIAAGYRVVRFSNEAVTSDLQAVLAAIRAAADGQPAREGTPRPRTGAW